MTAHWFTALVDTNRVNQFDNDIFIEMTNWDILPCIIYIEVVLLACKIRLKTGLYETTDYELFTLDDGIRFSPADGGARETYEICIDDLISITLTHKKNSGIEISTKNLILTGVLPGDVDLCKICQV